VQCRRARQRRGAAGEEALDGGLARFGVGTAVVDGLDQALNSRLSSAKLAGGRASTSTRNWARTVSVGSTVQRGAS